MLDCGLAPREVMGTTILWLLASGVSVLQPVEKIGALIRRLALSPFGYFVRRPVHGPVQPVAELSVVVQVVSLLLDGSLAWDRQLVGRIVAKLNN